MGISSEEAMFDELLEARERVMQLSEEGRVLWRLAKMTELMLRHCELPHNSPYIQGVVEALVAVSEMENSKEEWL